MVAGLILKAHEPARRQSALQDRKKWAQQFIEALPHARSLGMESTLIEPGEAEMRMPYDPRLVGDPRTGVLHGGAISTLIDTCCGAAVMTHPESGNGTATIDLRIDYLRSATPGQAIVARATCYHMTRSVAFVRATATDDNSDMPVASAVGSFTIERGS